MIQKLKMHSKEEIFDIAKGTMLETLLTEQNPTDIPPADIEMTAKINEIIDYLNEREVKNEAQK